MMPYVLGIDIGTQSTKALLIDAVSGRIAAQQSQGYQPDTPRPLWAEQHASVWLDAVAACIAGCIERAAVPPGEVAALCVSSLYGGSGIPVDEAMQPLHPCLIWMDRRAEEEVAWVRATIDQDRLFDITGNGVDSYYGYTKMLWLKRHRPEVWVRTRYLLPPNAFVAHALTGELAVDHSSAGNIGGVYDMRARAWSEEMLGLLGIPRAMMPDRLVESSAPVGALRAEWAGRLGLQAGTPVIAGGVDAAVATLAAGATRQGQHVAMIGTSMCWGSIAKTADARHGLIAMPHVFNGLQDLYVFGGAITAGASVSWFQEQLGAALPLSTLDAEAAGIGAGADGVVFLPYLMGERSPRPPVPRGAGGRDLRAPPQHRGRAAQPPGARRHADRRGRRGALRPVDAGRGRHHRLPRPNHRAERGSAVGRGPARRFRHRPGHARAGRRRLGHADSARPAGPGDERHL